MLYILEPAVSAQVSKSWDDACGENKPLVITEDTGVITSPNYPYTYFNNLNCQWLIPPESGRFVNMSLLDYEMQRYYDGVYIRDGLNNSAPNLGPVTGYMGNTPAITLLGSGEGVFVNFLSNANTRTRGFMLSFDVLGKISFKISIINLQASIKLGDFDNFFTLYHFHCSQPLLHKRTRFMRFRKWCGPDLWKDRAKR